MTLQNGLIYKRRAYLWADTAVTDPATGEIVGTVSKVGIGLNWPWAAVHSGEMIAGDPARIWRAIAETKPATEAALIEACRSALVREDEAGRIGRLLMAYPCRQDGARMFFMATDATAAGLAFIAHPVGQHACSPADDHWNNRFIASEFSLDEMRGFIDAQIKQPMASIYGLPGRFGGNLIEVRVTGAGVRPTLRKVIAGR